jgi:hypothetical protein
VVCLAVRLSAAWSLKISYKKESTFWVDKSELNCSSIALSASRPSPRSCTWIHDQHLLLQEASPDRVDTGVPTSPFPRHAARQCRLPQIEPMQLRHHSRSISASSKRVASAKDHADDVGPPRWVKRRMRRGGPPPGQRRAVRRVARVVLRCVTRRSELCNNACSSFLLASVDWPTTSFPLLEGMAAGSTNSRCENGRVVRAGDSGREHTVTRDRTLCTCTSRAL